MGIEIAALIAEADQEFDRDPSQFEPPFLMQPPSYYRVEAEELLGDEAPWHQVVVVAHALRQAEEEE